jgi:hypothetical protein
MTTKQIYTHQEQSLVVRAEADRLFNESGRVIDPAEAQDLSQRAKVLVAAAETIGAIPKSPCERRT